MYEVTQPLLSCTAPAWCANDIVADAWRVGLPMHGVKTMGVCKHPYKVCNGYFTDLPSHPSSWRANDIGDDSARVAFICCPPRPPCLQFATAPLMPFARVKNDSVAYATRATTNVRTLRYTMAAPLYVPCMDAEHLAHHKFLYNSCGEHSHAPLDSSSAHVVYAQWGQKTKHT